MAVPFNNQTAQELLGPDDGDYVGIQDLIDGKGRDWLVDVTDDATEGRDPTGQEDQALIGRTVRRAMAEVDQFIANRYAVPVTPPIPQQVKNWTLCLTIYFLARRRDRIDAGITEDMNRCIAQLEAVRAGDLPIIGLARRSSAILHNHDRDDTEPIFTLTRFNRSGQEIERDESGTLDVL